MRNAEEQRLKWKGGRTTSATAMGRPTGASADRLAGGPSFVVWAAGGASVPFESAGVDRPCLARFDSQHSANRWRRLPDLPEVLPDWRRPRRHGLRSPNRAVPRLESDDAQWDNGTESWIQTQDTTLKSIGAGYEAW